MKRFCVLALLVVALVGCLPKHSLSRRDEVGAALYALALDIDVTTEGAPVAPFRWHLDGQVAWSYTRTFRDGSMGHMVRFDGVRARVERGEASVDVPVPFADGVFEVRAFPDGEILLVRGTSAWVGTAGHLELLDALWAGLSPHLPGSREEAASFTTSWPAWVTNGPKVRNRMVATWTREGESWRYAGRLEGEGGYVSSSGTAQGEVRLGEGDTRLLAHTFGWERATVTRWPTGAVVTQTFRVAGSLTHAGNAPSPALDIPLGEDDPRADALPLRLRDGRAVDDPPANIARLAPFVLLPDDLSAEEREALRAGISGTW